MIILEINTTETSDDELSEPVYWSYRNVLDAMDSCLKQYQCDQLYAVPTHDAIKLRTAIAIEDRPELTELGYAP